MISNAAYTVPTQNELFPHGFTTSLRQILPATSIPSLVVAAAMGYKVKQSCESKSSWQKNFLIGGIIVTNIIFPASYYLTNNLRKTQTLLEREQMLCKYFSQIGPNMTYTTTRYDYASLYLQKIKNEQVKLANYPHLSSHNNQFEQGQYTLALSQFRDLKNKNNDYLNENNRIGTTEQACKTLSETRKNRLEEQVQTETSQTPIICKIIHSCSPYIGYTCGLAMLLGCAAHATLN